jgi:hypothetical protein
MVQVEARIQVTGEMKLACYQSPSMIVIESCLEDAMTAASYMAADRA